MSLFNDDSNESYTGTAMKVEDEMLQALTPIFKKYADQGVPVRQLAYLAFQAITDLHCGLLLAKPKDD